MGDSAAPSSAWRSLAGGLCRAAGLAGLLQPMRTSRLLSGLSSGAPILELMEKFSTICCRASPTIGRRLSGRLRGGSCIGPCREHRGSADKEAVFPSCTTASFDSQHVGCSRPAGPWRRPQAQRTGRALRVRRLRRDRMLNEGSGCCQQACTGDGTRAG